MILAVLIIPVFSLTVGQTSADALSKSGPARTTYDQLLAGGIPDGVLTPLEVLTKSGSATAAAQTLRGVGGINRVIVATSPDNNRAGTTMVIAIPDKGTLNGKTLAPVREARKAIKSDPGVVGITGVGAVALDYSHAVFGSFPLMFAIIAMLTFLLLARAFRSVVLAAKALVLNLISLSATFGLMTWFWQEGHGSNAIFGIAATGAITFWVPLMVFAFLFGLSMDYEVFILARMRESYDRTGSTSEAVVEALARTGRLVTSAALILFLAFASLASAPNTDLKVLATGLGAGILLDATVVRALLLPALVELFGRWNWWLPVPLAKVLRVKPSAAVPDPGPRPAAGSARGRTQLGVALQVRPGGRRPGVSSRQLATGNLSLRRVVAGREQLAGQLRRVGGKRDCRCENLPQHRQIPGNDGHSGSEGFHGGKPEALLRRREREDVCGGDERRQLVVVDGPEHLHPHAETGHERVDRTPIFAVVEQRLAACDDQLQARVRPPAP